MKIPEFWSVTPCQTVNSYRNKVYRSASIFRVKKFQKTASHYLTLKAEAPHTFETHVFTSRQDTWIFKSFHIRNSTINSILYSWIVCITSKALVYENVWFEQNMIILKDDAPRCLKYIKKYINMYFCKYWPDNGLLRSKLVANNEIIRQINIQLCQKEYIFNLT